MSSGFRRSPPQTPSGEIDVGSGATWARELGAGAVAFGFGLVGLILGIDAVMAMSDGLPWNARMPRRGEVLQLGAAIVGAGVWMGLLGPIARLAAVTTWRRVHPAVAMVWGPIFGAAVLVAIMASAEYLVGGRLLRSSQVESLVRLGCVASSVPWAVYLLLRMRGRPGWPAFVVAMAWVPFSLVVVAP